MLSVERQIHFHTPKAVLESVGTYFHTLTYRQEPPNHPSIHNHPLLHSQQAKEDVFRAVEMHSKLKR
jgi:hypothetical protein